MYEVGVDVCVGLENRDEPPTSNKNDSDSSRYILAPTFIFMEYCTLFVDL